MNKYLGFKVPKCGAMDSKYWNQPGQLEKDVEQHQLDSELFRRRVRNLILEDPGKMDIRYHQVIEELRNIKDEFGL
jgi:hypothetical protein